MISNRKDSTEVAAFYYSCFDGNQTSNLAELKSLPDSNAKPFGPGCSAEESPLLRSLDRDYCVEALACLMSDACNDETAYEIVRRCWQEQERIKLYLAHESEYRKAMLVFDNQLVGLGLLNRSSSIPIRLLARTDTVPSAITEGDVKDLLRRRASRAVTRSLLTPAVVRNRCGRLISAEVDGLPGVTSDLLRAADDQGSVIVFKFDTYGEDLPWDSVVQEEVVRSIPDVEATVVHKMGWRKERHGDDGKEYSTRLTSGNEEALGGAFVVEEKTKFQIPLLDVPQQSMWSFEEAQMRQRLLHSVSGRTVLDLYCGYGQWGIRAAAEGGAAEVVLLDESVKALRYAEENVKANDVTERVSTLLRNDIQTELEAMAASRLFFDVAVLHAIPDIKKRQRVAFGELGRELVASIEGLHKKVQAAIGVVAKGGLLILHTPMVPRSEDKSSEQMVVNALGKLKREGAIEWSSTGVGINSGALLGHHDILYSRTIAVRLT
ncbi:hypothetical protein FOL47_002469 [Perkinsus chesapeaki]|uniref:TRM5/TYW2-like methyltransferase domain-containing protein n=1 Tax=Perkinsus chesapeaki TaxID=330153 RepID=A0A7J6MET5_PERCH|nr:hypothetical protein FOL47_002469 [Perkinsus chesapeaki]